MGADTGLGVRGPWMQMCLEPVAQPDDPADFRAQMHTRLGFLLIEGWDLPTPTLLAIPEVQQCVVAASSCDGVLACFHGGAPASLCTPMGGPASCNGDTLDMCLPPSIDYDPLKQGLPEPRTLSVDCTLLGSTCVQSSSGGAQRTWGCSPGACDPTTFVPSCASGVAHRCIAGLQDNVRCGPTMDCQTSTGPSPDAFCVERQTLGPCDVAQDTSRCNGAALQSCTSAGWVQVSCGPGRSCQSVAGASAFCGVAADCDPATDEPHCDSDGGLSLCAFGARTSVACGAIGMSHCIETSTGPSLCQ
jgi:hypothetical protein